MGENKVQDLYDKARKSYEIMEKQANFLKQILVWLEKKHVEVDEKTLAAIEEDQILDPYKYKSIIDTFDSKVSCT